MYVAVKTPREIIEAAKVAPCPGCVITAEIRRAYTLGAAAKADKLRKHTGVKAAAVHSCGK